MASRTPQILCVDPHVAPPVKSLVKARDALAEGRLVVVPTETVYGLAADPLTLDGVSALYRCKQRTADKPFAFLAASRSAFVPLEVVFSPLASQLAEAFWPGPLTLVVPSRQGAVGVRIPDHPVTLSLLEFIGHPLAVTSANPTGAPPALSVKQVQATLGNAAAVLLDAGPSPGGVASTVLQVEGEHIEWLREGALNRERVERVLAENERGAS